MSKLLDRLLAHPGPILLSLGLFVAWLLLFTLGMTIDSEKYRTVLSEGGAEDLVRTPAGSADLDIQIADTLVASRVDGDTVLVRLSEQTPSPDTGATAQPDQQAPSQVSDTLNDGAATSGTPSLLDYFWALIVVVLVFTPPNLALLSCLAGVLGVIGRYAGLTLDEDTISGVDRTSPVMSGILRGFFVYLMVISGLLVLLQDPILGTVSPGQYVRFAGLISLTSFYVNYDPDMFAQLLDRVRDRLQEQETQRDETSSNTGQSGTSDDDENRS